MSLMLETCPASPDPLGSWVVDIDHNHVTGKVRGLLCYNCNRGLGMFRDDVMSLREAANYVETN